MGPPTLCPKNFVCYYVGGSDKVFMGHALTLLARKRSEIGSQTPNGMDCGVHCTPI